MHGHTVLLSSSPVKKALEFLSQGAHFIKSNNVVAHKDIIIMIIVSIKTNVLVSMSYNDGDTAELSHNLWTVNITQCVRLVRIIMLKAMKTDSSKSGHGICNVCMCSSLSVHLRY